MKDLTSHSIHRSSLMCTQVDASNCETNTTTSSSGCVDDRGGSNSSDDGNGYGDGSCSWNGSTISAASGCSDSRSEGEQDEDGTSEGGTNEEEYPPA